MVTRTDWWLDDIPEQAKASNALAPTLQSDQAVFVEYADEAKTKARVLYPADSDNPVVAPCAPGIYQEGATCPVVLASDGRISGVLLPITPGEGEPQPTGELGQDQLAAREAQATTVRLDSELAEQKAAAKADRQRITAAQQAVAQLAIESATSIEALNSRAVTSLIDEYATSTSKDSPPGSDAAWSATPPASAEGVFVWTRTSVTHGDGSVTRTDPTLTPSGSGTPGKDGRGIVSTTIPQYAVSDQGITAPLEGWGTAIPALTDAAPYLWTRAGFVYTDGTASDTYTVTKKGADGANGVGIVSITPYWRLVDAGETAPTKPTTSTPPSPWVGTEPSYTPGKDLYRVEKVSYSNGSFAYTTVVKVSAYTAAVAVGNLVDQIKQGLVKVSATDPGAEAGRIWWQIDTDGTFKGLKMCLTAGTWSSYTLAADNLLAAGSVKARLVDTDDLLAQAAFIEKLVTSQTFADNLTVSNRALADTFEGKTFRGGVFDGGLVQGAELRLRTAQAPQDSYFYTQDFAASAGGWQTVKTVFSKAGATYATSRVASGGRTGGALQIVAVGENDFAHGGGTLTEAEVSCSPRFNVPYAGTKTISLWIKASVEARVVLQCRAITSSGAYSTFGSTDGTMAWYNTLTPGVWTELKVTVPEGFGTQDAPPGRDLVLLILGADSSNVTYLIDDIKGITTFYGNHQVVIHQNDLGYPELVVYGGDGEQVVVSTRLPEGKGGLALYPPVGSQKDSTVLNVDGITTRKYAGGEQSTPWATIHKAVATVTDQTEWTLLPAPSGITSKAYCRRVGDKVELKGWFAHSSTFANNSFVTMGTLPNGLWPTEDRAMVGAAGASSVTPQYGGSINVYVNKSGVLSIANRFGTAAKWVHLDGCYFYL